jgi:hypothetical protein
VSGWKISTKIMDPVAQPGLENQQLKQIPHPLPTEWATYLADQIRTHETTPLEGLTGNHQFQAVLKQSVGVQLLGFKMHDLIQ